MVKKVIDVSYSQGRIDWDTVKNHIDGAILRCGYGDNISSQDDAQWARNVSECERLGIPYGVYLYSYADSDAHMQSEVDHILRLIKGRKLSYPVYIDLEDSTLRGRFSASRFLKMGEQIEKAGYWFGVYANLDWFRNVIGTSLDAYTKWVAQYNVTCDMDCDMWQYTSTGSVPGISGDVDMNECYQDFPSLILGNKKPETKPTNPPQTSEKGDLVLTGDYVNMRADAYVGATVIDCLRKGTEVKWLADDGWGWSKIQCGDKTGWMTNEYLSGKNLSKYKGVDIHGDYVNVRRGPGTEYAIIRQLFNGNYITCISIDQNGWMYAKINEDYAYVFYDKDYISIR